MRPAAVLGIVLGAVVLAAPAQAQSTRTWVSGVGDDVNPCSRTAPCKTFSGAISKTAVGGEINCLDPAGFGTLTITKSITVDCSRGQGMGGVLNAGLNAFTVNFNSFAGTDTRKIVRLRGVQTQGAATGTGGVRIVGGVVTGGSVFIEDSSIDNNFAGNGRGISDERTGGGELFITNTLIRNQLGSGIVVIGGGTKIDVVINGAIVQNTGNSGVFIGTNVKAVIKNSAFSGNTNNGIDVEGAGAEAQVDNTVASNNGVGLFTSGGGVLRMSNSDITLNGAGANGAWTSFGNNRFLGNSAPGTAPSAAGGQSHDLGQQ
ncbi:MAG TPA: right-handed parallel beta-helix repeat-containing protein [Beijerinckiaceae bacterium]|jgi:hypothetical protein